MARLLFGTGEDWELCRTNYVSLYNLNPHYAIRVMQNVILIILHAYVKSYYNPTPVCVCVYVVYVHALIVPLRVHVCSNVCMFALCVCVCVCVCFSDPTVLRCPALRHERVRRGAGGRGRGLPGEDSSCAH